LRQIAELSGLVPKAQLIVTEPELASGAAGDKIKAFVAALDLTKLSTAGRQSAA
jgi:hypothetical protein